MNDVNRVYQRSVQGIDAAYAQEYAAYQQAQAVGDTDGAALAAQQMAGLRATRKELDSMVNDATASQRAPLSDASGEELSKRDQDLCRHYGLSPDRLKVAKGWTGDERIPDTERVETYLRNKARYENDRASGRYRDDQGYVRR